MMKNNQYKNRLMLAAAMATVTVFAAPAFAQQDGAEEAEILVVLGTRSSKPRSVTDSPVPVDVISAEQFNSLGNSADLTDNLRTLVPSFTATPATGDGSAFIRPTSLRGMAPDQTLVLVNGRRRHRSALVQFFAPAAGNGAHGPDIGMIPGIALERVEVLRDGAAAQYGSDAIAGVINFQTRTASEGGSVVAQYGQFYEGESSYRVSGNVGLPLGDNGFLNISAEFNDNEALSRGIQRADAQALIDGGVTGVGSDSPFGDAPFVQTWGRPETSGTRLFVNGGLDLSDSAEFYFHGNFAETDGRYRFFYRVPNHSSIVPLRAMGFTGLQGGYTPYLDGAQTDYSMVAGIRGESDRGFGWDFTLGTGTNQLDYFLNNTLNPDLGLVSGQPAQRDFDVGGYEQNELNFNADFSLPLGADMNLAFGSEWRQETYTVNPGEPNSYMGAGSNGLGGFSPADSGAFERDNIAVYADLEHDVSDDFLMQYALRFEDYSDVGGTVNGKIAARYNASDTLTLRGAISTGFHAPTPGQSNVRTTITTFDGVTGLQVEEGLVPPTSAAALAVGGAPLQEEESLNFSLGFSNDINDTSTITVDFYRIEVDGRIYRTGDIPVPGSTTGATISFYTNALDVVSQGVDVVLTSSQDWGDAQTDFTFAMNYGDVEVTGQSPVGGVNPVSASTIEDIENNYPSLRFVATANTFFNDNWNVLARANFYGSHYDERGTINAATSPSAEIDATVYIDLEVGFQVNESLRIVGGASNIFDTYIDEIGAPNANRLSVGLQYPRRSAANYEGGSWYLRTSFEF
jgi:iron complex outermembrane receptor protein